MTTKKIFQLKSISRVLLHNILKRLLEKVCYNASLMCLFRFVAFCGTFNDQCCWTQRCGLLSRIKLRETDQRLQTRPNESRLHVEVVFVVCWHQIWKLVQVVYITVSVILLIYTKNRHNTVYWWHSNKCSNWKTYLACIYMIFWRDCWQRFASMFHLYVCLDLFAFHVTSNTLCCWTSPCGLLSRKQLKLTDQSWQTGPNESVLHFQIVFVVS